MSKTTKVVDSRMPGHGATLPSTGLELAMGASALGIFAEAALATYSIALAAGAVFDIALPEAAEPVL